MNKLDIEGRLCDVLMPVFIEQRTAEGVVRIGEKVYEPSDLYSAHVQSIIMDEETFRIGMVVVPENHPEDILTIGFKMDEAHVVDILKDGSNSWVDYEE